MGDASTMIILASLEAVATVIIVFLMLKHQTVQDQAWTAERRELLERIQRPDRIPSSPADPFVFNTDTEPDEFGLGGTIADPKEDQCAHPAPARSTYLAPHKSCQAPSPRSQPSQSTHPHPTPTRRSSVPRAWHPPPAISSIRVDAMTMSGPIETGCPHTS